MKPQFIIILLSLSIVIGFAPEPTSLKNEMIVRNFIESWDNHDVDKLVSLFSESCTYEVIPDGGIFTNRQEIARYANSTFSGIPDTKMILVSIVTNDSTGVAEWIWKGTNSVGWPGMGIPATDKSFEIRGISIMRIRNGLIIQNRDYWDWNTFIKGISE